VGELLFIHATNVKGLGAKGVARSILRAIARRPMCRGSLVILPPNSEVRHGLEDVLTVVDYRRRLPNLISRLLECLWGWRRFKIAPGYAQVWILGDLPIVGLARQVVLFHQANILTKQRFGLNYMKYAISAWIIRRAAHDIETVVVQTHHVAQSFRHQFPALSSKIAVMPLPPPQWVLDATARWKPAHPFSPNSKLKLFYPASLYEHKNHKLIAELVRSHQAQSGLEEVVLTIDRQAGCDHPLLKKIGEIGHGEMLKRYCQCDAVLFASLVESSPLVLHEAMTIGIPLVVPDLPYAREIVKDQGVYFDPLDVDSLIGALDDLRRRLQRQWRPRYELTFTTDAWDQYVDQLIHLKST